MRKLLDTLTILLFFLGRRTTHDVLLRYRGIEPDRVVDLCNRIDMFFGRRLSYYNERTK
jgi:hypothetical protein